MPPIQSEMSLSRTPMTDRPPMPVSHYGTETSFAHAGDNGCVKECEGRDSFPAKAPIRSKRLCSFETGSGLANLSPAAGRADGLRNFGAPRGASVRGA